MIKHTIYNLIIAGTLMSCGHAKQNNAEAATVTETQPTFCTDSAMSYLKAQTDLGPRVPGTEAHSRCAAYLRSTLERLGADNVSVQDTTVTAWNGDRLPLHNILARFGSQEGVAPVLLMAHWDSRPWADSETDETLSSRPIDGANDGASGVAILLEIARQAALNGTKVPVEILLIDGEDYGAHDDESGDETSWCLGTQAWLASDPYAGSQRPRFAVLLDMVGGRGARFHREYISDAYARAIVDMVWHEAAAIGLGDRFVNEAGGAVVDDHLFLNRAGIPAIDIIENQNTETGSFNPTWHTLNDTYENIDPTTIGDTGRLVSRLIIK
ncbi:MAG: M28 family peptidase [Muribaculaceae bacterium]|nr:M28 family peptidase [Muribaculaceae bacterium]